MSSDTSASFFNRLLKLTIKSGRALTIYHETHRGDDKKHAARIRDFTWDRLPTNMPGETRDLLIETRGLVQQIENLLSGELSSLPKRARKVLAKKAAKASKEAGHGVNHMPALIRACHASVGLMGTAWDLTITGLGPEQALIPSQIPPNLSSLMQYWGWLSQPSANFDQIGEMHINRFINALPHRVTYTVSIFKPEFYGTKSYFLSNVLSAFGILGVILAAKDGVNANDNRIIRQYVNKLRPAAGTNEQFDAGCQRLMEMVGELEALQMEMDSVKEGLDLSVAYDDYLSRMQSALNGLREAATMIATGTIAAKKNKDWKPKLGALIKGCVLVGSWLASIAKAPANLAGGIRAGGYVIIRLVRALFDGGYGAKTSNTILNQTASVLLTIIPFVGIPLSIAGNSVFEEHKALLITSSLVTGIWQLAINHHADVIMDKGQALAKWLLTSFWKILKWSVLGCINLCRRKKDTGETHVSNQELEAVVATSDAIARQLPDEGPTNEREQAAPLTEDDIAEIDASMAGIELVDQPGHAVGQQEEEVDEDEDEDEDQDQDEEEDE